MADTKITNLTEDTLPLETDLVMTVDDPAGTPVNKKVTLANLLRFAFLKSLFTAKGSLITASGSATPVELVVGTDGKVLTAQADGTVAWESPAAVGTPLETILTAKGSIVTASGANTPVELLVGTDGRVLTVQPDGSVAWAIPTGGGGAEASWVEEDVNGDLMPCLVAVAGIYLEEDVDGNIMPV